LTKSLVDNLSNSSFDISIIIFLIITFLIQTVTSGFSYYYMTAIGESIVASIRNKVWAHTINLPVAFYDRHKSGEIMSRITQDTNTVKTLITQHMITFISGLISIIAATILLFFIDWKITTIMLIAIPISFFIIAPLGKKMFSISKMAQDEMAEFSGNLGRVLSEIRLVKAYHAEEIEIKSGNKRIDHLYQFGLKEAKIQAIISPFMTLIMMLLLILLIGYGGVRVASGTLSAGSLVAIIFYMFQIVLPFSHMATSFTAFQKAMGATDRIQTILKLKPEENKSKQVSKQSAQPILFRNVRFSYNEKEPILKNISLIVPAGKTTAIVGPSGSGKTTLFSLLEQFYQVTGGEILLGDTNIKEFGLSSWRNHIGYVSQESPIMSGTILENITYGINKNIPLFEVERAATQANAMEFISRLPQGLATEVGERGVKLSGGQRQRIAIARALIRNPHILLLDEATSNLDSASEGLVQQALDHLMKGRTTLIIAHRLSTVVNADQIVILEHGEITGIGKHEELLTTHPLYQKLAEQQLQ
ncbi:ABC transporter ATP-binding protein, partial [Metabacillus niabensis]